MNQLTNEMFDKVKAFESKLQLWELQLWSYKMAHFPTLRSEKPTDAKKCAEEIQIYNTNLALCFKIFENKRPLSVCFHHHLMLMLKLFQTNFNCRL
jgi:hypothetical protein